MTIHGNTLPSKPNNFRSVSSGRYCRILHIVLIWHLVTTIIYWCWRNTFDATGFKMKTNIFIVFHNSLLWYFSFCPVVMSSNFWDTTPCSPLKVNRRFRGPCRLHLQGWRISQGRNQCKVESRQRQVPPKYRLAFNGLRGIIPQKTELFHWKVNLNMITLTVMVHK
jgi:hypothetical protein